MEREQINFDPRITLAELERAYILNALDYYQWNKYKAARQLGVTVKTLYNKLKLYKVEDRTKELIKERRKSRIMNAHENMIIEKRLPTSENRYDF